MLALGANTRLASVRLLVGVGQWCVPVRPLVGEILGLRGDILEALPLRLAPISTVP